MIASEQKQFVSDSGHWYCMTDGAPCYTVPNKSKPGEMRPTTLRDARVLNLAPSVSAIVRQTHKPYLEEWKIKECLKYSVEHPYEEHMESLDEYAKRMLAQWSEESGKVKDTGKKVHGAIEKWLESGVVEESMSLYVSAADLAIGEIGVKFQEYVEKSFAHPLGYGGRYDLSGDLLSGQKFVLDFKTKNGKFVPPFGFDEHPMQLAAYREGVAVQQKCPPYASARCFNVFISVEQPGQFYVKEWTEEELKRAWTMFRCLLNYWQSDKNYFPVQS
jgi:hypothetical protein